ncbi:hypothetical protein MKX03_003578 [Papaver bracteatum]|nr:hypothetical protein MKX03_003578 [Papaver bracteatum]
MISGNLGVKVEVCIRNNRQDKSWNPKLLYLYILLYSLVIMADFITALKSNARLNNDFGRLKSGQTVEWTMRDLLKGLEEVVLFKGHSTWVLRQAMPDTPILSLTPRHHWKYLKKGLAYVDGICTYFAGKDTFDLEDNYDTGTGDNYSLRQICGHSNIRDSDEARIKEKKKKFWEKAVDINGFCGPGEAWWGVRGHMRDDFNQTNEALSYKEHFQNSRFVESVLDTGSYMLRLGLSRFDSSVFNGYSQMVFVQISKSSS